MRRIPWIGLAAFAMIVAGIVIAFVGHDTLRWAPPPAPPAWAAAHSAPATAGPATGGSATAAPRSAATGSAAHGTSSAAAGKRARTGRSGSTPGERPGTSHLSPPKAGQPGNGGLPANSSPVSLEIPAIKVHASVIALGLNRNGTLAVPPLSRPGVTSWYDQGPAPGQPGAAAILGHVDATGVGPAVFYELGNLRPGAKIYVRLRNGQTMVFETYSVALYSKARFPTAKVFGYTSWPTLRLITCGGEFDQTTRHYVGNVVAFASYIGSLG